MSLYLARLMFAVYINNATKPYEFDEQFRLIESANLKEAITKAIKVGCMQEGVVITANNDEILWQFLDVTEVYELGNVSDGEQLYSLTHKTDDAEAYVRYIKNKSVFFAEKELIVKM